MSRPNDGPAPSYDLDAWRSEIPILETTIPLNNCSHAPQSVRTREAARSYLDSWDRRGMDWDEWLTEVENARGAFARLIGAGMDEVAVVTSVSAATSSVASALDFSGSRNTIVASEAEFPTVGHVWSAQARHGARVEWVPVEDGLISTEAYGPLLDDRVRVVSAAHAYYQNGATQDVGAIAKAAHDVGALIYVDAYQSLGTCPIDVKALDVDFLAGGTLKYLMALPGVAFLYIRESLIEMLEPTVTGWFGRENPFAFDTKRLDWASTARRFEMGTPPIFEAYVANAGLSIIEEVGTEAIHAWTRQLQRHLIEGALARGFQVHGTTDPDRKTPSTAILCPVDSHLVELALRDRGILASARGPVVRLAPHFYNTLEEMETALSALEEVFSVGVTEAP